MRLMDMRSGGALIPAQVVRSGVTLHHPSSRIETPAIRDEGIADLLDDFAAQVERRIFLFF